MKGSLYKVKHYIKINDHDWICYKESKIKYALYCAPTTKVFDGSVIQFKEKVGELDWISVQDYWNNGEYVGREYRINGYYTAGLIIDEKLIKSVKFKNESVRIAPTMSYNELKDEMEIDGFIEMVNREGLRESV